MQVTINVRSTGSPATVTHGSCCFCPQITPCSCPDSPFRGGVRRGVNPHNPKQSPKITFFTSDTKALLHLHPTERWPAILHGRAAPLAAAWGGRRARIGRQLPPPPPPLPPRAGQQPQDPPTAAVHAKGVLPVLHFTQARPLRGPLLRRRRHRTCGTQLWVPSEVPHLCRRSARCVAPAP